MQGLLGAITRAAPAPVAASPQSVGAWLKAAVRMRLALGVLVTHWAAAGTAAAGHALVLGGQRQAAVVLALEVMGRWVDRAACLCVGWRNRRGGHCHEDAFRIVATRGTYK